MVKKETLETVFVVIFIVLSSFIVFYFFDDLGKIIETAGKTNPLLLYFGIMLICFLGAVSIIIPIPYTALIFLLVATFPGNLNLIILSLFGGFGSALGELLGWTTGHYMKKPLGGRYQRRIESLFKLTSSFRKGVTPALIFIFAFTPLPDDIIFIVLGMINYSFIKALASSFLGKTAMIYTIGYFGGKIVEITEVQPLTLTILTVFLLIVTVVGVLFVDWEKILENRVLRA